MDKDLNSRLLSIEQSLDRLHKKFNTLLQNKKKLTWVRASVITGLTGWNSEKMRQARDNGYIEFKRKGKEIFYDANSLSELFLKKV